MMGERNKVGSVDTALRQASAIAPHIATAVSGAFNVCSSVTPESQTEAIDVPSGARDSMYPVFAPARDSAALSNASAASWPSTSLTRGRSPITSDSDGGASSSIFASWQTNSPTSNDPSNSSQRIAKAAASLDHVFVDAKGNKGANQAAARLRQETPGDCSILEESQYVAAATLTGTADGNPTPALHLHVPILRLRAGRRLGNDLNRVNSVSFSSSRSKNEEAAQCCEEISRCEALRL